MCGNNGAFDAAFHAALNASLNPNGRFYAEDAVVITPQLLLLSFIQLSSELSLKAPCRSTVTFTSYSGYFRAFATSEVATLNVDML